MADNFTGISDSLSPRRGERARGGGTTACNLLTGHCWDLWGFKNLQGERIYGKCYKLGSKGFFSVPQSLAGAGTGWKACATLLYHFLFSVFGFLLIKIFNIIKLAS